MNNLAAGAALAVIFLCGCAKPAVTSASAAPTTKRPPIEVRRAGFVRGDALAEAERPDPTNTCRWEITSVQVPEESIEQHGLAKLFEDVAEKNDVIFQEMERSPLLRLARGDTNIVLGQRFSVFPGIAGREIASNLIANLRQAPGVDILTVPEVRTVGTNEVQAYVGSTLTIFTGASSNSSPNTPLVTNPPFGHTITLQLFSAGPDGIGLRVAVRTDRFEGYLRDELDRMSQYTIGHPPMFGMNVLGARTVLKTNEVLLLASPPDFAVTKMISRVPKLSDLPGVGRLFTRMEVETNYFRTIWIIKPNLE